MSNVMRRYIFLLAAMLCGTATLLPAEKICVGFKDGGSIKFQLESHPVLKIYGDDVYMVIDGKAVSVYRFEDIHKIVFNRNASSAPIVTFEAGKVLHDGSEIVLSGFNPGGFIKVTGLDGITRISSQFDSEGCYRFNTIDLPSGLYILTTYKQTIKIMVGK